MLVPRYRSAEAAAQIAAIRRLEAEATDPALSPDRGSGSRDAERDQREFEFLYIPSDFMNWEDFVARPPPREPDAEHVRGLLL